MPTNEDAHVKPGQCSSCKGEGWHLDQALEKQGNHVLQPCLVCDGTGKMPK